MTTFIFSLALKQSQDEAKIFQAGRNIYGGGEIYTLGVHFIHKHHTVLFAKVKRSDVYEYRYK